MAGAEKTEQATPRRLEKARAEGNFPVSGEILAAVVLATSLALWGWLGQRAWNALAIQMEAGIAAAFRTGRTPHEALIEFVSRVLPVAGLVALVGGILMGAGLAAQLLQTGFRLSAAKLSPDFNRLNPLPRLTSLFGQNLQQLGRALLLLPVVGWLVWTLITRNWYQLLSLTAMPPDGAVDGAVSLVRSSLWQAASVLAVVAIIDLFQKRRKFHADLMMTRQEIRDEAKESEGNVEAKAQVRRMMRDLARRRMMAAVPKATAVVVNPTHYAVAIHYVAGVSSAPRVVAKGKNHLAARIRKLAQRSGVPIIENPPLARSLYRAAEVGQEIPVTLYRAVAEVLAYVYRMTGGGGARGR